MVRVAGRPGAAAAGDLAAELGARAAEADQLASGDCDLLLITVPDGEIESAARGLRARPQAPVALHAAGALGAEALAPLAAAGVAVGTFHPLRAFARPSRSLADAAGVFFALDGDAAAVALGRRLALAFGGFADAIPGSARTLYHFAATLAAGGVATLLAAAADLARRSGLPAAVVAGYGELARGALEAALAASDPATAITGPAARGDLATVERHLAALAEQPPELGALAVALAREALRQCDRIAAPNPDRRALAALLERSEVLDRPKDRVLTSRREP